MRRALVPAAVLTAASALAGAAAAQSAPVNGAGLRYLSWPGKPPAGARPSPAPAPAETAPVVTPASRTLPLARLSPPPAASVETPRRGLTPASDWLSPAVASQTVSQPRPYEATSPQPAPVQPAPGQAAPVQAAVVRAAPDPQDAPQPTIQTAATQTAAPQAEAPADPMAPRRDAPIFRLTQPSMAAAVPTATPPVQTAAVQTAEASPLAAATQGARFYSVHRQAGHRPDPIPQTQPVYLDALPVEMSQTPSSTDLAQPDGPPALIRNRDGSVRAAPPSVGGADAVDER